MARTWTCPVVGCTHHRPDYDVVCRSCLKRLEAGESLEARGTVASDNIGVYVYTAKHD